MRCVNCGFERDQHKGAALWCPVTPTGQPAMRQQYYGRDEQIRNRIWQLRKEINRLTAELKAIKEEPNSRDETEVSHEYRGAYHPRRKSQEARKGVCMTHTRDDIKRAMGLSAMEAYDVYHHPDDPPGRFNEDLEWPGETQQRDILRDVVREAERIVRVMSNYTETGFLVDPDDQRDIDAFLAIFDETEEKG